MKRVDTIARVRRAYYVQKWSMKKIVRELHVSRNTVRKILRSDETDFSYERERQPMPRIGPWQGQLEQLLSSNGNKPSRERLTLIRIFEELRGLGYEGGYDAVRRFAPVARARATSATGDSVLVTLHRAATTDDDATLRTVVDGLVALSARRPVVLPLHPRTRAALVRVGALARVEAHVHVVAPLGYLDLLATLHACALVVTDSGGLQKEAWATGRPAVVLRDTTEWVELVETGWVDLLAPQRAAELPAVVDAHLARERDARALYGDGAAGRTIAGVLAAGLTAGVTA